MSDSGIEIRSISVEEVRTIRQIVLRPGMPPHTCIYPNDNEAAHFGAFTNNRLIGIVTYINQSRPDLPGTDSWRLRGMATIEEFRSLGVGSALVEYGNNFVGKQGGISVWCNARKSAVGFYEKSNFNIISEEFEIPVYGPHYVMICEL